MGCSPQGRKQSATTEKLHFHFHSAKKLNKQGDNIQLWLLLSWFIPYANRGWYQPSPDWLCPGPEVLTQILNFPFFLTFFFFFSICVILPSWTPFPPPYLTTWQKDEWGIGGWGGMVNWQSPFLLLPGEHKMTRREARMQILKKLKKLYLLVSRALGIDFCIPE